MDQLLGTVKETLDKLGVVISKMISVPSVLKVAQAVGEIANVDDLMKKLGKFQVNRDASNDARNKSANRAKWAAPPQSIPMAHPVPVLQLTNLSSSMSSQSAFSAYRHSEVKQLEPITTAPLLRNMRLI